MESSGDTLPQDLAYRRDDLALKDSLYGENITAAVSGDKKNSASIVLGLPRRQRDNNIIKDPIKGIINNE